jgi:hypothetical protein
MISEDRKMSDRGRLAVPETAGRMTAAATAWLAALTEAQRGTVQQWRGIAHAASIS